MLTNCSYIGQNYPMCNRWLTKEVWKVNSIQKLWHSKMILVRENSGFIRFCVCVCMCARACAWTHVGARVYIYIHRYMALMLIQIKRIPFICSFIMSLKRNKTCHLHPQYSPGRSAGTDIKCHNIYRWEKCLWWVIFVD